MVNAYLDTSVLAAYYCPEAISVKADAVITTVERSVISQLVAVELASALSRKVREKAMSVADARRIWTLFSLHRSEDFFEIRELQTPHYLLAEEWLSMFSSSLRSLDALHLAVAFEDGLSIITCDTTLFKAAKIVGVKAVLVR